MNTELTDISRWLSRRFSRLLYICTCACVCVLTTTSCHDTEDQVWEELRHTVIIYMAAENTLSEFVASDSAEIANAAATLPEDVRVVLYIDDDKSSRLCLKEHNQEMVTVKTYSRNVCSTDSASMLQVLREIVHTFPAQSYGLVCWSHATGWLFMDSTSVDLPLPAPATTANRRDVRRRSFGFDNGLRQPFYNGGPTMNIPTLANVLAQLPHFEYILFDACFMQSVEVAYELRNVCNWMIGSPAEIPADGAPYHLVLPLLCANPFQAEAVVDAYHSYYDSGQGYRVYGGVELSAVAMSGMEQLAAATRQCVQTIWGDRKEAETESVQFYTNYIEYPDFWDMKSLFHKNLLQPDFEQWCKALSAAVPYVRLSDRWTTSYAGFFYSTYPLFDRAHCAAISAYAPINNDEYGWNKDYRRLQWYHAAGFDQAGW